MRLTVRIMGLEVLDFTATTDEDDNGDSSSAPFGFAGSGTGQCELSEDRMLDTSDSTRHR